MFLFIYRAFDVRFIALLMSVLAFCHSSFAQEYSESQVKTALVAQFVKHIEWPEQKSDNYFSIVVPYDAQMRNALATLNGKTINGISLNVSTATDLQAMYDVHLVYLSNENIPQKKRLLESLRGKGVLVVTENSDTRYNIMIDIVTQTIDEQNNARVSFQINRPNIVYEGLTIKPELILYGGTELDVASLYHETEAAIQQLLDENSTAKRDLELTSEELEKQRSVLEKVQSDYDVLSQSLSANQKVLEERQRALEEKNSALAQTSERLGQLNKAFELAKAEAARQRTIAQTQQQEAQANIDEQMLVLASLKQQVEAQNILLDKTNLKLSDTSKALDAKSTEVAKQAQVIDKQYVIILGGLFILLIFSLSTFIITRMFLRNRAINQELAETLSTLRDTQEHLIESKKLASLGEMVAGVAHEINTPIGIVVTSSSTIGDEAELFLQRLEHNAIKKSELHRFLSNLRDTDQLIQNNLDRCTELIRNFKQISADQVVAEGRQIYLKSYLEELMQTLSVSLVRNRVNWAISGDDPKTFLDPGLLAQIMNNLISNAVNHAFIDEHSNHIDIRVSEQGENVHIDFEDNGQGMKPTTVTKIFEPFFTTKRGRGGVGLGMNIVYNLVTSKLQGSITVDSEPDVGTRIHMCLPLQK